MVNAEIVGWRLVASGIRSASQNQNDGLKIGDLELGNFGKFGDGLVVSRVHIRLELDFS